MLAQRQCVYWGSSDLTDQFCICSYQRCKQSSFVDLVFFLQVFVTKKNIFSLLHCISAFFVNYLYWIKCTPRLSIRSSVVNSAQSIQYTDCYVCVCITYSCCTCSPHNQPQNKPRIKFRCRQTLSNKNAVKIPLGRILIMQT